MKSQTLNLHMATIKSEELIFICMCKDCVERGVHSAVIGEESIMQEAALLFHKALHDGKIYYTKQLKMCAPIRDVTVVAGKIGVGIFDTGKDADTAIAQLEAAEVNVKQ